MQLGIGYRVLGGIKFCERAEIKDAVSYLRIINQKFDDLALERVIGSPKKGMVKALNQIFLMEKIINYAWRFYNKNFRRGSFKPKIKTALSQLINMIHKWRQDTLKMKHYDLLKLVLKRLYTHQC